MADPAPPIPAYVDLRNFGDMPLAVNRLRDSEMASVDNAEIFRCAVLAWCAAWHQVPAASLPDDDATIARLVGMGRDVKGWRKVRAGALRGFTKASDGRLYHRVVAEKAAKAWNDKVEFAWKRECDRVRKANKDREKAKEPPLPMPPRPVRISSGWAVSGDNSVDGIPTETEARSAGNPSENALKGKDRIGSDIRESADDARERPADAEAAAILACYAVMQEHWPESGPDALNWPGLSGSTGSIRMWLREGCELERDILPVIRSACQRMKAKGQKARSFNLFTEDVGAAKARNTAPLPEGRTHVEQLAPRSRAEAAERDRREGIAAGIASLHQGGGDGDG